VAAPAFAEIARHAVRTLAVAPSAPEEQAPLAISTSDGRVRAAPATTEPPPTTAPPSTEPPPAGAGPPPTPPSTGAETAAGGLAPPGG
jgi:hypothetical protein